MVSELLTASFEGYCEWGGFKLAKRFRTSCQNAFCPAKAVRAGPLALPVGHDRFRCQGRDIHRFQDPASKGKRVIALDADLGWLSFETLSKLAQRPRTRRFGQATSSSTIDPMTPRSRFSIPFSTSSQNHFEFSERYVAGDT